MGNNAAELVSILIANRCVNDGTTNSGQESKNCDVLQTLFSSTTDIERICDIENRDALVVRISGSNTDAPKTLLLPHTDVVPATESDWSFDPFSGEIKDGYVHGRGAIDMFNVTASMAVAFADFIDQGIIPEGDITLIAVPDEENGGIHGAQYLYNNYPYLVKADYVFGETGGIRMPVGDETYISVATGEKGVHWIEIEIQGTPTHGSKPYGSDNAIVTAVEIIQAFLNYKSPIKFSSKWSKFLSSIGLDSDLVARLSSEVDIDEALKEVPTPLNSIIHACTHHTISPNIIEGGVKINTVADRATIGLDVRSLPGTTLFEVENIIHEILAPFIDKIIDIRYKQHSKSSRSSTDTPLWTLMEKVVGQHVSGAKLLEMDAPYGTDLRFGRNGDLFEKVNKQAAGYGVALFDEQVNYHNVLSMFHGIDEKVSIESLRLTTDFYKDLLLGIAKGL